MKIIGHRGAVSQAVENTVNSVQSALAIPVDMIEIDVRTTSDGVVVLSHDADLRRVAGSSLFIAESTFVELRQAYPDLATLDDVITVIDQAVPLMIECKPLHDVHAVVRMLQSFLSRGWKPENLLVGSSKQPILQIIHAILPQLPYVIVDPWSGVRATRRARQIGARRLAMNQRYLWPGFIKMVSKHYELYAYTVNDPVKAARWASYGLAGIFTDKPELFRPSSSKQ